ncbi:glutathione S-transferase family protein [Qipengyuania oceanensis]|uniref:Glutathione S-transferase family protein n=1 Tax=Qipengyuania oceanensis TaxID=1463597 RepID=A0A844YEX1_9SPHN|nr:glutathione S-transferase family protein [Qipengyuania oceanensis]MXO63080.1 glutathione S-transferase family protein [Qipengyuania oceanensis]
MAERYTLHEDPRSGNCFKIALTAALLGLPLERRQYDIMAGETRTEEFLARVNSNGRIPVLQIDCEDGSTRFLPESNAACWYLADGSALIPDDRFERADMLRWMFFEQYSHEPNVATLRFWLRFVGKDKLSDHQRAQLMPKHLAGEEALRVMNGHLATRDWFVGNSITLADIALYPYTSAAAEGGFDLSSCDAIRAWIERVEASKGAIAFD